MTGVESIYGDTGAAHRRLIALAMFVVWLGVVSFLAWTHLVWRDEVRALSKALQGDSVFAMLKALRGEGHPAVWYLLLRAAHTLVPRPEVLLLVSIVVAAVAALILVLRAPFSLPILALILISRFSMYEYSVMARNYGISMLLLFLFAAFYERHRDRDCLLGVLLFLLANCNVHSVLLVGGLLLFWFVDILCGEATNKVRNIRMFLYNAALAAIGVVTCFITVFPTVSDTIVIDPKSVTFETLIQGMLLPWLQLDFWGLPGADKLARLTLLGKPLTMVNFLILFGSTLGLIRRTGAFLAALTTLVGLSLIFVFLSPGFYRHQALWLVFLICMYWLRVSGNAHKEPVLPARLKPFVGRLSTAGTALFVLVLLLQSWYSAQKIFGIVIAPVAALDNRNNNLRSILAGYPELKQAVIVADPDFLLETLPYYVSNSIYLMREQRYGNVVHFTRKAQLELSLGDVLTNGRRLRQATGNPVVILLSHQIDPSSPMKVYREGYNWTFTITPEQAHTFQLSTRLLKHLAPAETSEQYYVYAMDK
ncbi:MAG: hypothetical protein LAO08_11175 [Acidobacteriia bacterium]|nr:hypothetical protein [Terriglobia bacterium]